MKDTYKKVVEDLGRWAEKWQSCLLCHDFVPGHRHIEEKPHHPNCPAGRARALVRADKKEKGK